jgi:hypothetical protein
MRILLRIDYHDHIFTALSSGPMPEVPATIGFAGFASTNFESANKIHRLLTKPPYNLSRAAGLLHHVGLL